jgi:sialate O-acetylesterase
MTITQLARKTFCTLPFAAILAFGATARADVSLPAIIGDHMVLQQDAPAPIWGWAAPDEKVTVKIGDQEAQATADGDGKWLVKLGPVKAGGPLEMSVAGKNKLTIKDVLVGEVWLCSGQSNMGMRVGGVKDVAKELAAANHPQIRMFTVGQGAVDSPKESVQGSWVVCDPKTVSNFSATAYFFGRDLHEAIKVPVGLINSSWGGTRIEPWISPAGLEAEPLTHELFEKFKALPEPTEQEMKEYNAALAKYNAAAAEAKKQGVKPPARPALKSPKQPNQPNYGRLFNAMISPLIPYAIRGAVWYQGESNGGEGIRYRSLMPDLITDWRNHWKQAGTSHDFPFLIVQLPGNGPVSPIGVAEHTGWTLIREAEMKTADKLPNVGAAVTIDTSPDGNLHPPEKQPVGHRLALIAENRFYGMKDVVSSGPVFDSAKVDGDKLHLTFKETHGGLEAKDGALIGFCVAGADHKFYAADATIEGDSVILHSAQVSKPVAARYAWAQHPKCNLFNKAGLPAGPFRTDDWDPAAPAAPVKRTGK